MEQTLISLARQGYREPREVGVQLLSLGVPREALWPAFGVVISLSVLMGAVRDLFYAAPEGAEVSYFALAAVLGAVFLTFLWGVWQAGRVMGGTGMFEESLLIGVFFQAMILPLQAVQIVLDIALPGLVEFYSIVLVIYGIWINAHLVDALHGFGSFGKSLAVLFIATCAAAVTLVLGISLLSQSFGEPV